MSFVHLHNHSEYSLLDGMCHIQRGDLSLTGERFSESSKTLVSTVRDLGQKAVALTDHGNMGGYLRFYHECKEQGIKPIIGCEFYATDNSDIREKGEVRNHLVLLAKNYEGLKLLFKLNKLAWEKFYYKPRIGLNDIEEVVGETQDIVVLTACIKGKLPQDLFDKDIKSAKKFYSFLVKSFGKRNVYIELMPHDTEEQAIVNKRLFLFAEKVGAECVLTNDCHYCSKEDEKVHDSFITIQSRTTLDNPKRFKFEVGGLYLKTEQEMFETFSKNHPYFNVADIEKMIENTSKIADEIDIKLPKSKTFLPDPDIKKCSTNEEYFKKLLKEGVEIRGINKKPTKERKKYQERLQHEVKTIKQLGFMKYFLIVREVLDFAKREEIFYGPGRGSSASSLVCYLLGITAIDPIKNDLVFSRFINPYRISPPDIDLDFQDDRRDEVFEFIKQRFGEEKTVRIGSYTVMKGKLAFKDVARVHGVSFDDSNKYSKNILSRKGGENAYDTIKDSLNESKALKGFAKKNKGVMKDAITLEGTIRQGGIHPCGIIASPVELDSLIPIETRKKSGDKHRTFVSALTTKEVEKLGFLKLDVLGLKTLTLLKNACKSIQQREGKDISSDLFRVDVDDKEVLNQIGELGYIGIFQFDTDSFRSLAEGFSFKSFDDIVSMAALGRPGPMQSGTSEKFLNVRNKNKDVEEIHPIYDEITKNTSGILIFQEQIIHLLHKLAGYPEGKADEIRNIISKSRGKEALEKYRRGFIDGCYENNLDRETAEKLFDNILQFGKYGFNKAHATAYGFLSYLCAWMRYYYPIDFFVALMNNEREDYKIREHIKWIKEIEDVEVIAPEINRSNKYYQYISSGEILTGFGRIKGIGDKAIESIVSNQPFENFYDFLNKINRRVVHKGVVRSLAKAKVFRNFCKDSTFQLENLEEILKISKQKKEKQIAMVEKMKGLEPSGEEDFIMRDVLSLPITENMMGHYKKIFNYIKNKNPFVEIADIDKIEGKNPEVEAGYMVGEITNIGYSNIGEYDTTPPDKEELLKREMKGEPQGSRLCKFMLEDMSGKIRCKIRPFLFDKLYKEVDEGKGSFVLVRGKRIPRSSLLYVEHIVNLNKLKQRIKNKTLNKQDKFFLKHPISRSKSLRLKKKYKLKWLGETDVNINEKAICVVTDIKRHKCKNDSWMAFVSVDGGKLYSDLVVWEEEFNQYGALFRRSFENEEAIGIKVERDENDKFLLEGDGALVVI